MWVHLWAFKVGSVVIGLVTFVVVSYISTRDWISVWLLSGYLSAYLIDIPCGVSLTPYLIWYFRYCRSIETFGLGSTSYIIVRGKLIRASNQSNQRSYQRDMNPQIVTVDQFVAAMASIQEAIASLGLIWYNWGHSQRIMVWVISFWFEGEEALRRIETRKRGCYRFSRVETS